MLRGIGWLLTLVSWVLMFTVGMKNALGAQFYLADITAGNEAEKPTIKSAYAKTKGRTATLAGNYLLLGLIFFACMMIFVITAAMIPALSEVMDRSVSSQWIPLIMILLVQSMTFLFAPAAAFEEKEYSMIGRVRRLSKGNVLRIVVVALTGVGISTLSSVLLRRLGMHTLIMSGITSVISLLMFGFNSAAAFVTYQTLKPKNEEPAQEGA